MGPVEVEAVVHMFSHETGYLTEIKPNAVVMANEVSTYPILEAVKLMCLAVESNTNSKKVDPENVDELKLYRTPPGHNKELKARYGEIFEEGFVLETMFPGYNADDLSKAMAGIDDSGLATMDSGRNAVANIAGLGTAAGVAATAYFGMKYIGTPSKKVLALIGAASGGAVGGTLDESNRFRGAMLGAAGGGLALGGASIFESKIGGQAAVRAATTGLVAAGSGIAVQGAIKSPSLQWFLAAPILFAKCLEEEVIAVMPLTKNGIPIVAGLSLKDPAMMWRHMFGQLYNYAQDTAIGMQDMAWFWDIHGESWWQQYVKWTTDGPGGWKRYRDDYRAAAGGG